MMFKMHSVIVGLIPELNSDGTRKNGTERILVQLNEYSFEEQPKIERITEKNKLSSHGNDEEDSTNFKKTQPGVNKWKKLKFKEDMKPPPSVDLYGSIYGNMYVQNKIDDVKLQSNRQVINKGVSISPDYHPSIPQLAADKSYVEKAESHFSSRLKEKNVKASIMDTSVPVSKPTTEGTGQGMRIKTEETQVLKAPIAPISNTTAEVTDSQDKAKNAQTQKQELVKQVDTQPTEPGS